MAEKVSVGDHCPLGSSVSPEEELTWPSFGIIITYSRSKMPRAKSRGREASCHLLKPLSLPSALSALSPWSFRSLRGADVTILIYK